MKIQIEMKVWSKTLYRKKEYRNKNKMKNNNETV